MAGIKVRDLAYGRLRSPDLDAEEEFLTAFGMVRAARTPTALYMRGTDPVHHIHVTEKGDPAFIPKASVPSRSRTRSATRAHSLLSVRGSAKQNSSPPSRPAKSVDRNSARTMLPMVSSTS